MADIIELLPGDAITLPEGGGEITYKLPTDGTVEFAFDVDQAVFSSNGNDLIITIEGQGTIIIEGYLLQAEAEALPVFELIGGVEVPGEVYLFAFDEGGDEEIIETAANAGLTSSGVGTYSDDSGDVNQSLEGSTGQGDRGPTGGQPTPTSSPQPAATAAAATPPSISGSLDLTMDEDQQMVINESDILSLVSDAEGDPLSVSDLQVDGGTLTVISSESWLFTPDADFNGDIDLSFTVTDGTFTVTGTGGIEVAPVNDPAEFDGDSAGAGTEDVAVVDGDLSVSGDITVSDVDAASEELMVEPFTQAGSYGTFTINADGEWSYAADNSQSAIQGLGNGESLTETFTISSVDGTEHDVTITINGTEDAPTISGTATGAVTEDDSSSVSGTLTADDVDAIDTPTFTEGDTDGAYGTLSIDSDGNWTYTLGAQAQALTDGQTATETFTVTATTADGESVSQQITIDVTGTADAAVISGDTAGAVTEDDATLLTASGTLTVTDADAGESSFEAETIEGTYGSLSITSAGAWTYAAANSQTAIQGLGSGQSLTETFTVASADGTEQTVTVTINGTEDAPTIAGTATGAVVEDVTTTVSGTLTADDLDAGDNPLFTAESQDGDYGSLEIDADGNWTYTLGPDAQALAGDEAATETFTVTATTADGETVSQDITVDVTGTNDGPTLDFDGADLSFDYITNGSFEGVEIAEGDWAQGHEPEGWTLVAGDRWEVMSGERNGIIGATDGENVVDFGVGGGAALVMSQEVGNLSPGQYVIQLDLFDRGENLGQADSGPIEVRWDGEPVATFTPGTAEWETGTVTVNVTGNSGTLTLASSNNDAYGNVVDNIRMFAVNEADNDTVTVDERATDGTYVATAVGADVDTPVENLTYSIAEGTPFSIDPETGVITVADGSMLDYETSDTYLLDVTVSDGTASSTQTLTISIGDVSEGPVTVDDTATTAEDTATYIDVLANDTDLDGDDLSLVSVGEVTNSAGEVVGTATIEDGQVLFTPNANYNGDASFEYTVTDGSLTDTGTATVEVTPVDDGPTLAFASAVSADNLITNGSFEEGVTIPEGGWAQGHVPEGWSLVEGSRWEVMSGERNGIIGASDGDNVVDFGVGSEALVIEQTVNDLEPGQYVIALDLFDRGDNLGQPDSGTIEVYWDGELVGTFNPGTDAWETGTVTVDVTGNSGTLTLASSNADAYGNVVDNVTMHSVGDAVTTAAAVSEDAGSGAYVATAVGADIDSTDLTYSIEDGTPFAIDPDTGVITLADGASLDYETTSSYDIAVTVTAADGGTTTETLTIDVGNVNESPVTVDDTVSGTEDTAMYIDVMANDSDLDGDDLSLVSVGDVTNSAGEVVGTAVVDNGQVLFTPNANYNGDASFEYTVSDGELTETGTATVNVAAVNDAPTSQDFTVTGSDLGDPVAITFAEDVNVADLDGTVTEITVTGTPQGGTLYHNGVAVTEGSTYAADGEFTFQADSMDEPILLLGSKDGAVRSLDNWGGDSGDPAVLTQTVNGNTVTVSSGTGSLVQGADGSYTLSGFDPDGGKALKQYDENSPGHMGFGIGDKDGSGIESGETISVDFGGGLVSTAVVGFDGLGGHFEADASQQASAVWIAMRGGEVVGSGDVVNATDNDSLFEELTITTDMIEGGFFDSIVFTTNSDAGSNWELRYVEAEFGVDTEFTYVPIDDQGLSGNESTVSIEMAPAILTTEAPVGEGFNFLVDDTDPIAIDFDPYVSDLEDDASGEITEIKITSLPENGTLFDGEGNEITETGGIYDLNEVTYVANDADATSPISGAFLGAREAGDEGLANWGVEVDDQTRQLDLGDGISVTVSTDQGKLTQYSENQNHVGIGIGDSDGYGIEAGETITVDFDGAKVSYAEIAMDGLGGHFQPDGNGETIATATWTAYNGEAVVAQGNVINTGDSLEQILTIDQTTLNGQLFDRIEFSTESDQGSNWELKYVDAEFGYGDSFNYVPVDSDGMEGNESSVTFTMDAPNALSNLAPTVDLDDTGQHLDINAADADSWGYNLLGMYVTDGDGNPVATEVLYNYTDVNGPEGYDPGDLLTHLEDGQTPHFFILNSGNTGADRSGPAYRADSEISFTQDETGQWYGTGVDENGNQLTMKAFFDDTSLNVDNHDRFKVTATSEDGDTVTMSVEEYIGRSVDYDDIRFTITTLDDDNPDYDTVYTEGGAPVSLGGTVEIADADTAMMSEAVITLTNAQDGDVLDTSGVSGLFVDVDQTVDGQITVTLSGTATAAEYEDAIEAITFSNTSDNPDNTPREVTVQVTDSEGNQSLGSNLATTTIGVVDVTDPAMVNLDVTGQDVEFVSQNAGYTNMLGIYHVMDGMPSDPEIILVNSKQGVPGEVLKTFAGDDEVRFFLIPNGGNQDLDLDADLHFVRSGGNWELAVGDDIVDVKFDDPQFNPNGEEAGFKFPDGEDAGFTLDPEEASLVSMDDQFRSNDDDDFNDLRVEVRGTEDGLFEGGSGDDVAYGMEGDDTLEGAEGNDILVGGDGDDLLIGGAGDDMIFGGDDDDEIITGDGTDTVHTGAGSDTVFIDQSVMSGGSEVVVEDFNITTDKLELGDGVTVKDIMTGTQDDIEYTQVLVEDTAGNEAVVKLLGVSQADFGDQTAMVDTDTTADDLIQTMIDADNNSDF